MSYKECLVKRNNDTQCIHLLKEEARVGEEVLIGSKPWKIVASWPSKKITEEEVEHAEKELKDEGHFRI
jgi:hypothetical protein